MAVGKKITRDQQQLFGADLARARAGKKTRTGISVEELEILAAKPVKRKRTRRGRTMLGGRKR